MRAALLVILAASVLGGGGTFLWLYYGGFSGEQGSAIAFVDAYGDYTEVADQVEMLVHLPGTEGNRDRAELQALLESILTETLEPQRRDALARMAFANLEAVKDDIDAAQRAQAQLYTVLQNLDNAARTFKGIELRNLSAEIVSVARERAALSAHITSVLSEINEHTYAIITRILAENGELSAAHINEINAATDNAVTRADALKERYEELLEKKRRIQELFAAFIEKAL